MQPDFLADRGCFSKRNGSEVFPGAQARFFMPSTREAFL